MTSDLRGLSCKEDEKLRDASSPVGIVDDRAARVVATDLVAALKADDESIIVAIEIPMKLFILLVGGGDC